MTEYTIDQLARKIARWGFDRQILINGKAETQMLKMTEEVGELAAAVARKDLTLTADAIGDCFVVLVMITELSQLDLTACIQAAYDTIKDRKGHLNAEGVFIKEGDAPTS